MRQPETTLLELAYRHRLGAQIYGITHEVDAAPHLDARPGKRESCCCSGSVSDAVASLNAGRAAARPNAAGG